MFSWELQPELDHAVDVVIAQLWKESKTASGFSNNAAFDRPELRAR